MYIPPKFKIDDPEQIQAFIRENPFGLLLSISEDGICDTHTPFVFSECGNYLLGHIAKANDHWKGWKAGTKAKVIFTGAHAYISPGYYESEFNVPTWNYTAVSVSGTITTISDQEDVLDFLDSLTKQSEKGSKPWTLDRTDERYMNLLSGIVVFRVSLDHVEASFKMNQNKSEEDQSSVISSLKESGCPYDHGVADFMEK